MEISAVKTAILRAFITDKQGKPEKSHNRPTLERKAIKFGYAVDAAPTDVVKEVAPAAERLPPLAPKERARNLAKRPRAAKAAKPEKRAKPAKVHKPARKAKEPTKPRATGNFRHHDGPSTTFDVPTKSGEHKTSAPDETVKEVRRLVKAGTSLRGMCAALETGKFLTARGGKSWSPSSVQAIMRAL